MDIPFLYNVRSKPLSKTLAGTYKQYSAEVQDQVWSATWGMTGTHMDLIIYNVDEMIETLIYEKTNHIEKRLLQISFKNLR